jgi:hypothetical protein
MLIIANTSLIRCISSDRILTADDCRETSSNFQNCSDSMEYCSNDTKTAPTLRRIKTWIRAKTPIEKMTSEEFYRWAFSEPSGTFLTKQPLRWGFGYEVWDILARSWETVVKLVSTCFRNERFQVVRHHQLALNVTSSSLD